MNENRDKAPSRGTESADDQAQRDPADEESELDGEVRAGEEAPDEVDDDDDVEDESGLDILVALAELDAEAATAYRIGASAVDDPEIRTKLEEFAADHVGHIRTLNRLLADAGAPEVSIDDLDEGSSAITMLAAAVAGMGDRATLMALIGNEQLTNSAYPNAMDLPFEEEEVLRIFERHATDERRHLEWLLENERILRDRVIGDGIEA
jgi:rubrerythrin